MTTVIAYALFVLLVAIAALHVYWGFGGVWPAKSEEELIRTVVGVPEMKRMPSAFITVIVAVLIAVSGTLALLRVFQFTDLLDRVVWLGCAAQVLVFGLRGASGIANGMGWINVDPPLTDPFATLDFRFYSPLCIAIALGFLALLLKRPA